MSALVDAGNAEADASTTFLVPRTWPRTWLSIELFLVFGVLPVLMVFVRHRLGQIIIPSILTLALLCLLMLLWDRSFDRRRLWRIEGFWAGFARILKTFVPGVLLLNLLTAWLLPERWLAFPRQRPELWQLVMLLYPVLSVYPQELVFRAFIAHRYRAVLSGPQVRIVASAVIFGLAHLFFGNWVAPVLSTLGGFLFARTYERSGSLMLASLEHALWGDALFTIGLGWYFYGGAIR